MDPRLAVNRWFASGRQWLRRRRAPLSLGQRGEREAARFLKRQGYKIVARSDRSRLGEIDLVAVDRRVVVFVEVKTRASDDAGHPTEAVDLAKQRQLTRLALGYLKRHGLLECSSRFDVVAVTWAAGTKQPTIEHYRNAFEPTDRGQMFS